MRIVIAGAGEVGSFLAQSLSYRHDVVVIERSEERVSEISQSLDVLAVEGDASMQSVQVKAGVDKADLFIAVASSTDCNIVAALVAKEIGANRAVVRISQRGHEENPILKRSGFHVIYPERALGRFIANMVSSPHGEVLDTFEGGTIQLVGMTVPPGWEHSGKRVSHIPVPLEWNLLATLNEKVEITRGESVIREGERILAIGRSEAVEKLYGLFGLEYEKPDLVVVSGGGKVARYLVSQLAGGPLVRVIEKREEKAERLAQDFPKLDVFQADGTDTETLIEAGVNFADHFIALTGDDENNVLSSMLAGHLGAKNVVALMTKADYLPLLETLGVVQTVSLKQVAAKEILKFIHTGSVIDAFILALDHVEAAQVLEIDVPSGCRWCGRTLSEIPLPAGSIIGMAVRDNTAVIPRGGFRLSEGDRLLMFAVKDAVDEAGSFFSP